MARYNRVQNLVMAAIGNPAFNIPEILERLSDLEERVFKTTDPKPTTLIQQLLLLKHTGLLDVINAWPTTKYKKAQFLHLLLNRSRDNIEGELSSILEAKWRLDNEKNLELIVQVLNDLRIQDAKKEIILEK